MLGLIHKVLEKKNYCHNIFMDKPVMQVGKIVQLGVSTAYLTNIANSGGYITFKYLLALFLMAIIHVRLRILRLSLSS